MRSEKGTLERIRIAIGGVTVEDVASRAKKSKSTFLRADEGLTPDETTNLFMEVLETIRRERIEFLNNLKIKVAG